MPRFSDIVPKLHVDIIVSRYLWGEKCSVAIERSQAVSSLVAAVTWVQTLIAAIVQQLLGEPMLIAWSLQSIEYAGLFQHDQ